MPDKCVMNKCIFPIHSHQHRIKVSEPKLATLEVHTDQSMSEPYVLHIIATIFK